MSLSFNFEASKPGAGKEIVVRINKKVDKRVNNSEWIYKIRVDPNRSRVLSYSNFFKGTQQH